MVIKVYLIPRQLVWVQVLARARCLQSLSPPRKVKGYQVIPENIHSLPWAASSSKPPLGFGNSKIHNPLPLGFRIPNCSKQNSSLWTPPPLEFRDAAHGMGIDIFWNHPLATCCGNWTKCLEWIYIQSGVGGGEIRSTPSSF